MENILDKSMKRNVREKAKLAIDNIIKEGTTDVDLFARPFEIELLKEEQAKAKILDYVVKCVCEAIQEGDLLFLEVSKIENVLVPKKSSYDFRCCALIDIVDEIKYLTLVLLVATKIENKRVSRTSKQVYSYRLSLDEKDGYIFSKKFNYTGFTNRNKELLLDKKNNVLIKCDISNFYDRLNLHRLESTLLSYLPQEKRVIKIINELLLFWANRDSYGLPVGSNASRILAEAALVDVDKFMLNKGIKFIRFVDDYRIYTKDAIEAQNFLAIIIKRLSQEGLFLNSNKTSISDESQKNNYPTFEKEQDEDLNTNKNETVSKIIRGYSGLVPTKFRQLTENEKTKYKLLNSLELKENLLNCAVVKEIEFVEFIKTIVAKEDYFLFEIAPKILAKLPQFIPYFVDVIQKFSNCINDNNTIKQIKNELSKWFNYEDSPEYVLVYLVRLFASDSFYDKNILINYFRKLPRNAGAYIGRSVLEGISKKLDRSDVIEIRSYYDKADIWEKRMIIKIVQEGLPEEEAKPFFKNIKYTSKDIFSDVIVNVKKT